MTSPLRGIKVLDFSRLLPGPYATQLLRDLGASVTKVENSDSGGDPLRHYLPKASDGTSSMFHAINRGKGSVSLGFRDPDSTADLTNMVSEADVVVESFRPGVLEQILGVQDGLELLERHPQLVLVRLNGYGKAHDIPGHDINFAASAGVLGMMAEPSTLPVQFADLAGGAWPAALQVCAALYARDSARANTDDSLPSDEIFNTTARQLTPRDRLIEVNMAVAAHSALVLPLARRQASGEAIGAGRDLLAASSAAYGVFPTQCGGHIAIGALEPHFWAKLCEAAGLDACNLETALTSSTVREALSEKLLKQPAIAWEKQLQTAGVPATRVVRPEDASAHLSTLTGVDPTVELRGGPRNAHGDPLVFLRSPLCLGTPADAPAPSLGADNGLSVFRK
jgi:crotonobetainyl-CoA:carnitine CoA-transferase CaiB-like acyl-CoA transferase